MKPGYEPTTTAGKLLWLAEEAAEVSQGITKTLRIAVEKRLDIRSALLRYNPDVPVKERETNHAWIYRELCDLKLAIQRFESSPIPCLGSYIDCGYSPSETFTCPRCKKLRCYCQGSDANECVECSHARKTRRDQKKSKSQARPSHPKAKRAAARKPSQKGSTRARRQ